MKPSINLLAPVLLILAGLGGQNALSHPAPGDRGVIVATRITAQNFAAAIRGTSAIAGTGDWMLSNGTLCASFSDPGHETYLSHRGGTLVDLGFCGRNDDQWNTYHEMFNLSRDHILPAIHISTEKTDSSAAIIVKGKMAGVENETRYQMDRETPTQLVITTRLTRTEKSDALYLFGALILHPHRSLTPFTLSTATHSYSKGFNHPFADTDNKLAMLKVMFPADLHVLVGADHIEPEISYAVQALSAEFINTAGEATALRQFAINDQEFSLLGYFTNPLWLDTDKQPGLLQFAQTPLMDLDVGESLLVKNRILVSQRADVASITDQLYRGYTVQGKTDNAENRILVTDTSNSALTFIKPDKQGLFAFRLPVNVVQANMILNTPGFDAVKTLAITGNTDKMIALESGPVSATLFLPEKSVMRLVFKGINHTPDPVFYADASNFRVGDKRYDSDISTNTISLAGTATDPDSVSLAPGDYIIYATQGPEFSLSKMQIKLQTNAISTLRISEPVRLIATPEWITADFHVHSEFSFDSTLPIQQRIRGFVAQGGEVIISSEHKRTIDYLPFIQQLGLQNRIRSITGVELTGMAHTSTTPRTIGHNNVFPVEPHDTQFLGGTLPHENRRLGEVIDAYKTRNADVIFQLNHPRARTLPVDDINFFDHLSINKKYNAQVPIPNDENKSLIENLANNHYRDIDFDAIELLNGSDTSVYPLVREDWFSLLRQGYRKIATANSDSHDARNPVALPRNYIRGNYTHIDNKNMSGFDETEFLDAIRKGNLFGSTGPILDVHLENAGMGETYRGTSGKLQVVIKAAPWINVSQLSVYLNGTLWRQQVIIGPGTYILPMTFTKNSFVTVEVEGRPGEDYQAIYPGFAPHAFSNPIYIETGIP